jgi:hypothetical protein
MSEPDNHDRDGSDTGVTDDTDASVAGEQVHSAGAFDVRTIIGGLLGIYGVMLLIMGLWFTDSNERSKADGENLNLTVGIGLIVVSALFFIWLILRPLRVPVELDTDSDPEVDPARAS